MARTLVLVPYNPDWPREFESIATDIENALGNLALRIDHIGSTAVPGMAAKDVIDIQVVVEGLHLEEDITAAFVSGGFEPRNAALNRKDHVPPGWTGAEDEWRKLYYREPPGHRYCHIHVRAEGKANTRYALLFRDYLRANPHVAESWADFKQRLAGALANDRDAYVAIKDPATDVLMHAAEMWVERKGWKP